MNQVEGLRSRKSIRGSERMILLIVVVKVPGLSQRSQVFIESMAHVDVLFLVAFFRFIVIPHASNLQLVVLLVVLQLRLIILHQCRLESKQLFTFSLSYLKIISFL